MPERREIGRPLAGERTMAQQRRSLPPRPGGPALPSAGRDPGAAGTIVDRRFERERVVVSGGRFERCTFLACELVFDGRPAHLVDNLFEDCSWSFEGAAGATLEFVTLLCREDPGLRATLIRMLGLPNGQAH